MIALLVYLSWVANGGTCQVDGPVKAREEKRHVPVSTPHAAWELQVELVPNRIEMARILEIAKNRSARDYVALAILAHLGLRVSELVHIKSDDLVNGMLRVTRRKKRVLRPNAIEVPEALWKILKEWADSFDGYIFPGNAKPCVIQRSRKGVKVGPEQVCNGGHLHIRCLQRNWGMYCAEAGLRMYGRGIHQTRHYFGSEFYAATKDLRATQVALGHSSSQMTERYAHIRNMREQVNVVKPVL